MRHYYAEWCPYGVDTISYDDQLVSPLAAICATAIV